MRESMPISIFSLQVCKVELMMCVLIKLLSVGLVLGFLTTSINGKFIGNFSFQKKSSISYLTQADKRRAIFFIISFAINLFNKILL